ncbi:MAG TPA: diguanylate cyclase, partial [Actinomycetota bacterium]|nr:diguanylate cyclase [Actinomycetota bacterium]
MPDTDPSVELKKLADDAEAIAAGHFDRPIDPPPAGDLRRLAEALDQIAGKLQAQMGQLREYNEALTRAHIRFGEALRATHDLERMLEIALETGMEAVRARSGLLVLRRGGALVSGVSRNLDRPPFKLELGQGIAGHVAATGTPALLPGSADPPPRAEAEPDFPTQLSVPLFSHERVLAVLNFYDKQEGLFTETDLRAILSLTDQAGVAIENVLLHQEAERMAIMDGKTGIWNHRWFQIQFAREIDRAQRFRRPFSLIVLDIDDFRRFNNTYGHQVGDYVLIELAQRIRSTVRDVDMFARYGGEEFELLLSETDEAGGLNAAEKIRQVIAATPFESEMTPEPLHVTISAGVATYPSAGTDFPSIFKAADLALL